MNLDRFPPTVSGHKRRGDGTMRLETIDDSQETDLIIAPDIKDHRAITVEEHRKAER